MLAIAGGVAWGGYLLFVYGLSQLAGQNYSIADLAIPGKFTLGNPAPDQPTTTPQQQLGTNAPGTSSVGTTKTPGTVPKGGTNSSGPTGQYARVCKDTKTGKLFTGVGGKCPPGSTSVATLGL